MNKRRRIIFIFVFAWLCFCPPPHARADSDLPHDRIVMYEMKEDPTMAAFIGVPSVLGFYALEIDEWNGKAIVYFTDGTSKFVAETKLSVKKDQLTLIYKKRRKKLVRATLPDSVGSKAREVIHPVECPPEQGGWRYGASFERKVVPRVDDVGKRIAIRDANLQFDIANMRCGSPGSDCEPAGCSAWTAVAIASAPATVQASTGAAVSPSSASVPFSKALLNLKLNPAEFMTTYKSEIDTVLPLGLSTQLAVVSTGVTTSSLPFNDLVDPVVAQQGLKIGVISKTYVMPDLVTQITIEIEPLPAEFQADQPKHCGTWDSEDGRSFFTFRGQPAHYTQKTDTPPLGTMSWIVACGKTFSVTLRAPTALSRETLEDFLNKLPMDEIERIFSNVP